MAFTGWEHVTLQGQRFRIRYEYELIETDSPQGEVNATDCSGAGCTQRSEPGVRGPGKILSGLERQIETRVGFILETQDTGWSNMAVVGELRDLYQDFSLWLGVEASEPPQDAE